MFFCKIKTPIAPLWNWNSIIKRCFIPFSILQSHLYGIEILWELAAKYIRQLLQSHLYGIEMYFLLSLYNHPQLLQSHLYGIEIQAFAFFQLPYVNSNRTFMELKYNFPMFDCSTSEPLQSHLYGIEMFMPNRKSASSW